MAVDRGLIAVALAARAALTMTDAISETEYREERESLVESLFSDAVGAVEEGVHDEFHRAVFQLGGEDVEYHTWFDDDRGATLHGSIIEHAEADPSSYSDWSSLIESDTPEQTVKRLAYCVMEADVIEKTLERADDAPA